MKKLLSNGPLRLFLNVSLILVFGSLIFSLIWFMVSSPGASIFSAPAPTQDYTWSYVEIPKPAKVAASVPLLSGTTLAETTSTNEDPTAIPVPLDTEPMPAVTETPGEMTMEIVEDTSAPVYAAPERSSNNASYSSSKYILVDISEQHMYVYDGDSLIYSFVASTGINNATRVGTFAVQSKIPNAYGSTWNIWMPNWLGIYWAGGLENGIHALPILSNGATLWEGYLGRPVSYGCVVLGTYESGLLYDWAEIGVTVEIQW
jgi:lipoprotein-anchoring transpeptidase ErfK/SrfK